jgi:hypothetical protein
VVIRNDDTVVIRLARSEMGQGTLTGLCQLVAEELDCDWSKVTWGLSRTPQSRVGRFFSTCSRGIRMSHESVRKGGATAREMLKQAAANEWKLEPMNATALYTSDKCEVWGSDTERRGRICSDLGRVRLAGWEVRSLQAPSRRRLRPTRFLPQPSEEPPRPQCGGAAHRLGQTRAARHLPRARAHEGVQRLRRGSGGSLRHWRQQDQDPPDRRGH